MLKNRFSASLVLFTCVQAYALSQNPSGWKESRSSDRLGNVLRQYRDEDGNTVYQEREVGGFVFKGVNIEKKIGYNDYYPVYRIYTKTPQGLLLFRQIGIEEVPIKKEDCEVPCSEDILVTNPNRRHQIHVGCFGVGARSGLELLAFDINQNTAYFHVLVDVGDNAKVLIYAFSIHSGTWSRVGQAEACELFSAQLSPSGKYLAMHKDIKGKGRKRDDYDADSFIEVINLHSGVISSFPKLGEYEDHRLNGTIDIEKFEWLKGDQLRFVQKMSSEVPPDMRPPRKVQKMGPKIVPKTARKPGDHWENVVGPELFGN